MTALTKIAAGNATAESKTAKASLARLNGPALNAAILSGAERGETILRVVFIEQIALRGLNEGLPLLLKLRSDSDVTVRAAAVSALGELAPPADNKIVLDWAITATDANEQARALRALVNITLRNPDVAGRGATLYAAMETAPAELALRLLPALGRIGGAPSAASAGKLALSADLKLSEAATSALVRWSDDTAITVLVSVAERTSLPTIRASAVTGVIAAFERNRAPWNADATALIARLLAVSAAAESRLALITLLKRAADALALAPAKRSEPRVAFASVVEMGLLAPGTVLTDEKRRHNAVVRADGALGLNQIVGSIHKMGALAQGLPACNGWTFWHYETKGGLKPIDALRAQIRVSMKDAAE
jgi:hypothetical protein